MVIKGGIKTFKVHISPYHKLLVSGGTLETAKQEAWHSISAESGYYRYGWLGWQDFNKNVLVEET